jgi:predicted Zn-dependent protease
MACGTISVNEEKRIGAEAQRQIRGSLTLVRDKVIVDYVRKLGAELVAASRPSPFEVRFYVVEDETLNAFAIFGGAIYMHTGIVTASNDVAELAGVMAHEIGHITARHLAQNVRRRRNTGILAGIATMAIAVITGSQIAAQGGEVLTSLGAQTYLNSFTREAEAEADDLAIETLSRAGYDPEGMIRLFRTLQAESGDGGIRFLQDHPTNDERIDAVSAKIAALGVVGGRSDDRGRLPIIQERIKLVAGSDADYEYEDEEDAAPGSSQGGE